MSISVALLAATGMVGQKVIALLQNSSHFKITELAASERCIGKEYNKVCEWREPLIPLPVYVGAMKLKPVTEVVSEFVISCLPSDVAEEVEFKLSSGGKIIFSNAAAFRMHKNVPLLIPEINFSHLSLLKQQKTLGKIITNPNCAAVGAALALAPLMSLGTIEHVSIITLQSTSGAGYPGVSSLDLIGNVIPYIEDEASKITEEIKKILGGVNTYADFTVTTNVFRVPVLYGHFITLHVKFKHSIATKTAMEEYNNWNAKFDDLFVFHEREDRPQPIRDLTHDDMRVHIGHLKHGETNDILSLVVLSHNLVRGAAGAVIANMNAYLRFM
ncbi:aspartate-semialdehyde dehydrogenase [Wolbachia pipientis]|uniref:Aspartate-semialdehyde dehydrogenase n=1 Tax=Wolbachia pipientis TaxID=955 RepID=A0A1E7QL26_WOLPI|nr:aspartate-semialdehyde dehydrogenase [Wolbachia pipientis]OEY86914.1 aspartate-semialdehyde dehydrogenase [Wolbachia pipientis]